MNRLKPLLRHRGYLALFTLLAVAGATALALPALALQIGTAPPATFELDGNAVTDHAGAVLPDDWDRVYCQVTGLPAGCTGVSTGNTAVEWAAQGPTTGTTFTGGGSKDPIDVSSWAWNQASGGLPGKDILLNGFAARYNTAGNANNCPGSSNGSGIAPNTGTAIPCSEVFFGMDRFDNSGDAQNGFWFFQNSITLGTTKSGGGQNFVGVHKNGDVLVVSDFSIGGTISTITVYMWNDACTAAGKPMASCADANLQTLASSTAANCTSAVASAAFCGIVNAANATTSPWPFTDKSGNTSYQQGEFYEGGIDLSNFPGLANECFASTLAESRSSTSTSAVLKSFVLGGFGACTSKIVTTSNPTGLVPIGTGTVTTSDSATLTVGGAAIWSGNVLFHLCGPNAGTCATGGTLVSTVLVTNNTPNPISSGSTTVNAVGLYCWRADFISSNSAIPNATDSGATDANECFTVTSAKIVTTSIPTGGVSIGTGSASASDSATLTVGGATAWNGTVSFSLCGPNAGACTTGGTAIGSPISVSNATVNPIVSSAATVTSVGSYCWRADFTSSTPGVPNATDFGSGNPNPECFTVNPVTPTLTTQASSSVTLNNPISDTATLSGTANQPGSPSPINPTTPGAKAGGSITFTAFGPNSCTTIAFMATVTVSGNNTYGSGSFTPTAVGTYTWEAVYTPDNSGNTLSASATACPDPTGHENVTVTDTSSSRSAQTWLPNDTATVASGSGKPSLNGTLTLQLFDGNATCSGTPAQTYGPVIVTNAATATISSNNSTFFVNATDSVSWKVSFTSSDPNVSSSNHCESTSLTITN